MPLPSTHPFLLESAIPRDTAGVIVKRGLVQWLSPDSYTKLAGSNVPARVGNGYTCQSAFGAGNGIASGIATTFGGRNVYDLSRTTMFLIDNAGLSLNTPLTFDIWVYVSSNITNSGGIVAESSSNTGVGTNYAGVSYLSNTGNGQSWFRFIIAGSTTMDTSYLSFAAKNAWHNFAMVIPGTTGTQTVTAYWNGLSNKSVSASITRPTTSYFVLGNNGTNSLVGRLGDFKVYNVALDSSEIQQNYNAMSAYYARHTTV